MHGLVGTMTIELDLSHIRLCGRQDELNRLRDIFAANRSAKFVLIEGESGAGKSALMTEFERSTQAFSGRGKFESGTDEPLAAMTDCLRSLITQLRGGAQASYWQHRLGQIDTELRTMSMILPEVEDWLDDSVQNDEENVDLKSHWAFKRLRLAIRTFLRVVGESEAVILLIDDLQWADTESVLLLRTLVSDAKANNLLVVGSLRLGDDDQHPILKLAKDMSAQRIRVPNLTLAQVTHLLGSLLRLQGEQDVAVLSSVIHHKTSGNVFFVLQLIRMLHEKRLIAYSLSHFRWVWDLERIKAETDVSENVVVLLTEKMQDLPVELRMALTLAAFLGPSRLNVGVLSQLLQHTELQTLFGGQETVDCHPNQLLVMFDEAVKDGLLEHLGSAWRYKFSHDRIKESLLRSLPADYKVLHLCVGRRLQGIVDQEEAKPKKDVEYDSLVILAAHHLSSCSDELMETSEKALVARLFLRAASLAAHKASYNIASDYESAGLELLGTARWETHNQLTLQLSTKCAYSYFCSGKLDLSLKVIDDVLKHANCLEDKIEVHRTWALNLANQNKIDQAIAVILDALALLDLRIPRRCQKLHLVKRLIQLKRLVSNFTDEDVLNLPETPPDFWLDAITKFIPSLGELCLMSGDRTLWALVTVESIELTLTHGYRPRFSCSSVASIGAMFAVLGEVTEAVRFGRLAVQMAEMARDPIGDGRAMLNAATFCLHWKMPYHTCLKYSLEANKLFSKAGACEELFFSCFCYAILYFSCGLHLRPLQEDIRETMEMLTDYSQHFHFSILQPLAQLVLNLRGENANPLILTGEYMDQDDCVSEWTGLGHERALNQCHYSRMYLAYMFNDYDLAGAVSEKLMPFKRLGPVCWLPPRLLFEGLVAFALAQKGSSKRRNLRHGRSLLAKLEDYVRQGNVNCHHMLMLLRAELVAVTGANPKKDYDLAISAAGRLGFLQMQALANERAGIFFLDHPESEHAEIYISRALDLYSQWGAIAKVKQMKRRYSHVIDQSSLGLSPLHGPLRLRAPLRGSVLKKCQKIFDDYDSEELKKAF